ncbi:MAG: hypothetical protein JWM90_2707 [Thermoleophilia bacterium]|nr:hypothetical protein [Thermoleophilia bacterium]
MTNSPTDASQAPAPDAAVVGGGPAATGTDSPVRRAAAQLELLSEEARELVLGRMDPAIADQIRMHIASLPDRPHGEFSGDIAARRQMLHATAQRVSARKVEAADRAVAEAPAPRGQRNEVPATQLMGGPAYSMPNQPAATPAPAGDALVQLRTLHPAAIARAMQGERAEAWAIVLDRLDVNAHAALQLYLDASARIAIEDARARQKELGATAPALIATIEAAIARTVVPRAMREHHQLLSTTPLAWTGITA